MTRQVATVEELDALPVGTVIRDADYYYDDGTFGFSGTVMPREEEGWLFDNCCEQYCSSDGVDLPATVLYEPGAEARRLPGREQIERAVAAVLANAGNHPAPSAVLGLSVEPLCDKVVDAVLALLRGDEDAG